MTIGPNQTPANLPRRFRWQRIIVPVLAVLACAAVFAVFHETLIGNFLHGRCIETFELSNPGYSLSLGTVRYNLFDRRLQFDRITLGSSDSTLACSLRTLSLEGVGFISLISGKPFAPDNLDGVSVDASDLMTVFPRARYALQCRRVHGSVADSLIEADSIVFQPTLEDEPFFADGQFRRTRVNLTAPQLRVHGWQVNGLVEGRGFTARFVELIDPVLDMLVNKDKATKPDSNRRLAPQEQLAAIEKELNIDSLRVTAGAIRYAERFGIGDRPAVLTFDRTQIRILGISNRADSSDSAHIMAVTQFMNAAWLNVDMVIPLRAGGQSLYCTGSLSAMDISRINWFTETAVQKRIKSGTLHAASFVIDARSGHATGAARAYYQDLNIVHLEGRNVLKEVGIYLFHKFKLRKNNVPEEGKSPKVGEVIYASQPTDGFFRFIWMSIRSGLMDILGL